MKKLFNVINYLLIAVFIAASLAVAYVAIPNFGNKALIVRSGSMEPSIKTGDLIVIKSQEAITSPQHVPALYFPGEVIAYESVKAIVTHRITEFYQDNGKILYQTKGDANKAADKELVPQDKVLGKKVAVFPYIGKLIAFSKTNIGFPLLVIFPAFLVIISESYAIIKEIKRNKRFVQNSPTEPIHLNMHTIFPLLTAALVVGTTYSLFSDVSLSQNNLFAAATSFGSPTPTATPLASPTVSPSVSPSPSPGVQAGDVVINEIMWMGSSKGTSDEWVELRNTTTNAIDISGWQITRWSTTGTDHEELMLTIPNSSNIPASGFFLVSNKPSSDPGSALDASPDYVTTSVSLSNTNLQIKLYVSSWDTGGNLVDTAGDKGQPLKGEHQTSNPKKFYSMERNTAPNDGTQSTNWHTATTSVGFDTGEDIENRGTPKTTNSI